MMCTNTSQPNPASQSISQSVPTSVQQSPTKSTPLTRHSTPQTTLSANTVTPARTTASQAGKKAPYHTIPYHTIPHKSSIQPSECIKRSHAGIIQGPNTHQHIIQISFWIAPRSIYLGGSGSKLAITGGGGLMIVPGSAG